VPDGWDFWAGADLSVNRDFTGLAVVGKNRSIGICRLFFLQVWKPSKVQREIPIAEVEASVIELYGRFRFKGLRIDAPQALYLQQRLSAAGVPCEFFQTSGADKDRWARQMLDAFGNRTIQLYRHPQLVDDLRRVRLVEKQAGTRLSLECLRSEGHGHGDSLTALQIAHDQCHGEAGTKFELRMH
jgi:hypothetical protein